MAEAQKRPRLNFVELAQTPITILLEHYGIVLTKTKTGFRGDCPFPIHTGGKGTFGVHVQENYFQCFSLECQRARGGRKGGNCIGFVQAQENISDYYEAAARLSSILQARAEADKEAAQSQVVETAPEVKGDVVEQAERFMTQLDKKLDADFRKALEFMMNDDSVETWQERMEITLTMLKKTAKREVLASYRNGKAAAEK